MVGAEIAGRVDVGDRAGTAGGVTFTWELWAPMAASLG